MSALFQNFPRTQYPPRVSLRLYFTDGQKWTAQCVEYSPINHTQPRFGTPIYPPAPIYPPLMKDTT